MTESESQPESGAHHRKSTDNLCEPWKPGQSGNPSGKKKGTGITARLREIVLADNGTAAKAIADAAIKAAKKGDFRFFKELCDRLDGPIKQQLSAEITRIRVVHDEHEPEDEHEDE